MSLECPGNATGLSGGPSITVADIIATGNVSIAGTLTYEDVTSIDAVGIVTSKNRCQSYHWWYCGIQWWSM